MLFPSSRILFILSLGGMFFLSIGMGICFGGGMDPNPVTTISAPVTPVIPAPVPPSGHHIRYQDLIPGHNGKIVEPMNGGKWEPVAESGPELTLGECIAIAVEHQPNLKAVKASIGASEAGYRALMHFGTVGTIISPDLEIRKQQAQRGLAASSGEYQKTYNEVIQDVTRLYYLAVYAKQQGVLANDAYQYLQEMAKLIEKIINSKLPADQLGGLNVVKLRLVQMGVIRAEQLRIDAATGRQQALAALREAMGVDEKSYPFRIKDLELPVMSQDIPITQELVVEQALCRRPELALAAAGVDVFRLEVYAQGKIPFKRVVPTFASGADLHAKEIPQTLRAKDYRPGAIIPEMPVQLVGSKYDRVDRAMFYSQKAEAVYEKVRGLIILEAQDAYFQFANANLKLIYAKKQLDLANDAQQRIVENAESTKEKDQVVQGYITTSTVKSDYVKAVLEHIQALAALERITAGGIQPAFPGR